MMAWLFFIFWIHTNIFCNFSVCRLLILISEMVIRFVFPLAFQCRIPSYSAAKTCKEIVKRKQKRIVLAFPFFWIRSNIFCTFSGCRHPFFQCFDIFRFVFLLAFQCCILNYSTAKTREVMVKRKQKVKNDC